MRKRRNEKGVHAIDLGIKATSVYLKKKNK